MKNYWGQKIMNEIENGVSKVLEIERVNTETESYFKVRILDFYKSEKILKLMSIKNIEKHKFYS